MVSAHGHVGFDVRELIEEQKIADKKTRDQGSEKGGP